jgi:RNA polymerase sigma factor (TIGR02999 family)
MDTAREFTRLLAEARRGDHHAMDQLVPVLYEELRRVARGQFRRERGGHTLQPTALIHEAYIRLIGERGPIESRGHFLALAATHMRRILLDYARRHRRRGGSGERVLLDDSVALCGPQATDILTLDRALEKLARLDPGQAQLVELRFFAGLSIEETAEVTGLSTATVERGWRSARAFLRREMEGDCIDPRAMGTHPGNL